MKRTQRVTANNSEAYFQGYVSKSPWQPGTSATLRTSIQVRVCMAEHVNMTWPCLRHCFYKVFTEEGPFQTRGLSRHHSVKAPVWHACVRRERDIERDRQRERERERHRDRQRERRSCSCMCVFVLVALAPGADESDVSGPHREMQKLLPFLPEHSQ